MRTTTAISIIFILFGVSSLSARESTIQLDYSGVVPLSGIEHLDGSALAPPANSATLRQAVHEAHRSAAARALPWPRAADLRYEARRIVSDGVIPMGVLNFVYSRGEVEHRGVLAAPLVDYTYRASEMAFVILSRHVMTNEVRDMIGIEVDFDDGVGYRNLPLDTPVRPNYTTTGRKTIRSRLVMEDGEVLHARATFTVRALTQPVPDDTIAVTATIPYQSQYGVGEAYVYLAAGHTAVTQPIVLVEGFDLDNTMNWDELYALLNKQNLLEDLRADGYDAVVLNFTEATNPVQENAYLLVELLTQVEAMIAPQAHYVLVGASMGGLVSRYALAYMETNAIAHRVATYISFDTPHRGANIPLGIQYWLDFFSGDSDAAAFLLSRLDTPAARQMLVYHHTDPASSSPAADPLRASFQSDIATLGNYPAQTRNVAIANGNGTATGQAFAAGAQIIDYNYSVPLLATVKGNIWAVPDGGSTLIFEGYYYVLFGGTRSQNVSVTGTFPYDNAPGGYRNSMAQMDSTEAPAGDIVALYDNHCFIPTISALDLSTADLFYDIDGDPSALALSPFDAIYYPTTANQEHVDVTAENAVWLMNEIKGTSTGAPAVRAESYLAQNFPNPFNPSTTIVFNIGAPEDVTLRVYEVSGRLVRTLASGYLEAGSHRVTWDGTGDNSAAVASGVYFYRLVAGSRDVTRKMVLLK